MRMVIDDNHKLFYAMINKAGSRSLTAFMQELNHVPVENRVPITEHIHSNGVNFRTQKLTEVVDTYADYIKFTILRHPLQRLVSYFYDAEVDYEWRKAHRRIRKGKAKREDYWCFNASETVNRFVRLASEMCDTVYTRNESVNSHWREYLFDIQPCDISYDFIFKTETVNHDMPALRAAIGEITPPMAHEHSHGGVYLGFNTTPDSTDDNRNPWSRLYEEYDKYLRAFHPVNFQKCLDYHQPAMEMFGFRWDSKRGRSYCEYPEDQCC